MSFSAHQSISSPWRWPANANVPMTCDAWARVSLRSLAEERRRWHRQNAQARIDGADLLLLLDTSHVPLRPSCRFDGGDNHRCNSANSSFTFPQPFADDAPHLARGGFDPLGLLQMGATKRFELPLCPCLDVAPGARSGLPSLTPCVGPLRAQIGQILRGNLKTPTEAAIVIGCHWTDPLQSGQQPASVPATG